MKVPKSAIGNRLEGTFIRNGLSREKKFQHIATLEDIEYQEGGQYGDRLVIVFAPAYEGGNMVSLNRTSVKRLAADYSDETDEWIGKRIILRAEQVAGKGGRPQDAVTVSPHLGLAKK